MQRDGTVYEAECGTRSSDPTCVLVAGSDRRQAAERICVVIIPHILWYVYHTRELQECTKYDCARAHRRIYMAVPGLR